MKLVPLADRVVLKMTKAEETTKSGIILTEGSKEKPQIAEVIAVGPGGNIDGKEIKMYVKVGDKVSKGQVLGIVEAMKLMNEIESEFDGTVKEILVENEQMVEFGQPMFVIE